MTTLLGVIALAAAADPADAPSPRAVPDPAALVRDLGDDEFAEREAAGDKLRALGARAIPALTAGARSGDPEVAWRSRAVVKRIEHDLREAFVAGFAPDHPAQDHRVWDRFKAYAGDDRAARLVFVEVIRDPQRFARMDYPPGGQPMTRDEYRHLLMQAANSQAAWGGGRAITRPEPLNAVGDIGYLMYLGASVAGGGDHASQLEWRVFIGRVLRQQYHYRPRLPTERESPADARARAEARPALLRFLLSWAEARRDSGMVELLFEEARLYRVAECLPLARKWVADPKAGTEIRVAALRLMGTIGDPATDVPRMRGLFGDAAVVGTLAVPPEKKVVLETQLRDVAVGMALALWKEDPADHGFPAPKLLPREYQSGPLSPHGLAFPSGAAREAAHRAATKWLDARPKGTP